MYVYLGFVSQNLGLIAWIHRIPPIPFYSAPSFLSHPFLHISALQQKIIHHSCNFSMLRNCLLFKQKGYLNCYVAQLFMPVHKNAWVLLWRKVSHYNESNCFHPILLYTLDAHGLFCVCCAL